MKLFSYVVVHDSGFAPNPFWGYCTLADCKPTIRRTARAGDWIAGLSTKAQGNKLIYAMRVDEILTYAQYFADPRFTDKKPDYRSGTVVHKCGDNIYEPLANGGFRQLRSMHSNWCSEDAQNKERDLSGKYVLISQHFYYFGQEAIPLPERLQIFKVGRAHRCRFPDAVVAEFLDFIVQQEEGLHAPPSKWPQEDTSWRPPHQ
jgi:hypothetical protein